jgi:quinol monooxygenase YgiN
MRRWKSAAALVAIGSRDVIRSLPRTMWTARPFAEENGLSWRMSVNKVALSVTLKAKPGKEEAVAAFLASAQSLVAQEAGTISWFAFRVDQRTFGMFDSFRSDAARQAHLQGAVAAALLGRTEELLEGHPEIRPVDILAEKLPA